MEERLTILRFDSYVVEREATGVNRLGSSILGTTSEYFQ